MKKIMLFPLLFVSGLFSAEVSEIFKHNGTEQVFIFRDGKYEDTGKTVGEIHVDLLKNPSTHHHHHGHSGWSLVGCFAGGVVVTVGTLGALAYLGYDHVKPDVNRFLDLGEHGIKILGAIGKGVGEAATTSK